MSYYTAELKDIVESCVNVNSPLGYNDLYEAFRAVVYGDSKKYPNADRLFSFITVQDLKDSKQGYLAMLFLYKYITREICYETYGRWKAELLVKWSEMWDKYSRNFQVDELEDKIDPLVSYESFRWGDNKNNSSSSSDGRDSQTGRTTDRNSFSDTPQGTINNVENDTYLTNYTKDVNDSQNDSFSHNETKTDGNSDFRENAKGTTMSYAKLLEEFRATSHADVEDFLAEFEELFFQLW